MDEPRIVTSNVCPPIPYRGADWAAWDDKLGADTSVVGYGPTEEAAIADFKEKREVNE